MKFRTAKVLIRWFVGKHYRFCYYFFGFVIFFFLIIIIFFYHYLFFFFPFSHFFSMFIFVSVEVLQTSQPNGVMSSAVSLHNHTFTGQAYSSKSLTSIEHILLPETDNYTSWNSSRWEWPKKILHQSLRMLPSQRGSNPQPPDHQLDGHPTVFFLSCPYI